MQTQAELTTRVNAVVAQLQKVGQEIDALKALVASGAATQELIDAINGLTSITQVLDDKNEDAAVVPPTE